MIAAFAAIWLCLQQLTFLQAQLTSTNSLTPRVSKKVRIGRWSQNTTLTLPTTTTANATPGTTTEEDVQKVPIKIGTALTLDCCSKYSAEGEEMYRAYRFFAEWANLNRGGVQVQGQRRPVDLTVIDDHSSEELARDITEQLVTDGVNIFLGPYGSMLSEAAANVVNASGGVMVAPSADLSSVFEGRPRVFGTLSPAAEHFQPVFGIWSELGVKSVIAIQDEAPISHEACSGLPEFASRHGMAHRSTLTIPAGTNVSDFIRTNLTSHLGQQENPFGWTASGEQADALVACVLEDLCEKIMRGLQQHDLNFKAVAFSLCVTSARFLPELGDAARFVMGATPWVPNTNWRAPMEGASTFSGFSSADFADLHRMRYGSSPTHQSYSALAAGLALIVAIEAANSTDAVAIASALRALDIRTMSGTISFDASGMNAREMLVVQYPATGSTYNQLVSAGPPKKPRPTRRHSHRQSVPKTIYPMPTWSSRPCFRPEQDEQVKRGLLMRDDERCDECPPGQLPLWTADAWFGSPAWMCLPMVCSPGYQQQDDGSCIICKAGTAEDSNRTCITCLKGRFSSDDGAMECVQCLPGSFSSHEGQTECDLCPPGYSATQSGQEKCLPCPLGSNASSPGTSRCELCASGAFTNGPGSLVCMDCPAGKYRPWTAESCGDCEIGRFQDMEGQSFCHTCPSGTSCEKPGMTIASIDPGWWVWRKSVTEDDEEAWKFVKCSSSGACLSNRCEEGHTDILCGACLPDYYRGMLSGSCLKCPSLATNIPSFLFVAVVACISTLVLAAWSIGSARESKAITSALLKLFLNYLTTMTIMGFILNKELKNRASLFGESSDHKAQSDFVSLFRTTVFEALGGLFSLDCLLAPSLSDDDSRAVHVLSTVPQSVYFNPEYDAARTILRDYHYMIEWRHVIFWSFLPIGVSVCLVVMGSCLVTVHTRTNDRLYDQATDFFDNVNRQGWRPAVRKAQKNKQDWHEFAKAYQYRYMGIWHVLPLSNKYGQTYLKDFLVECEPLLLIAMFLCYPYVIKAFLRPLSCVEPLGSDFGLRIENSVDLKCYNNDTLFWLAVFCMLFYGFVLPAIGGYLLFNVREKIVIARFKRTFGFITGGYEVDRNFWENVTLIRKSIGETIAAVGLDQGLRILLIISASLFFSLLHVFYQPFDNRYDELLDGVEGLHLLAWVIFGLGILALHLTPEASPSITWLILIILLIIHICFLAKMLRYLFRQLRNIFAESMVEEAIHHQHVQLLHGQHEQEQAHSDKDPGSSQGSSEETEVILDASGLRTEQMKLLPGEVLENGNLGRMSRFIMWTYIHRLDQDPYLAADGKASLCQIQGNMGSECSNPPGFPSMDSSAESGKAHEVVAMPPAETSADEQRKAKTVHRHKGKSGPLPDFSALSAVLPSGVKHPTDHNLATFVKIVMEAFEYIIVNQEITVFSSSLLDFVIRASMAFGSGGNARHVFLAQNSPPPALHAKQAHNIWEGLGKVADVTKATMNSAAQGVTNVKGTVVGAVQTFRGESQPRVSKMISHMSSLSSLGSSMSLSTEAEAEIDEAEEELRLNPITPLDADQSTTMLEKEALAKVEQMFDSRIFWRGVTLEEMQLNLSASIMTKTSKDLVSWFNYFEARWKKEWLTSFGRDEAVKGTEARESEVEEKEQDPGLLVQSVPEEDAERKDPQVEHDKVMRTVSKWHFLTTQLKSRVESRDMSMVARLAIAVKKQEAIVVEEAIPVLKAERERLQAELAIAHEATSQGKAAKECHRVYSEIADIQSRRAAIAAEIGLLSAECRARGLDHTDAEQLSAESRTRKAARNAQPGDRLPINFLSAEPTLSARRRPINLLAEPDLSPRRPPRGIPEEGVLDWNPAEETYV